MRPPVRGRGSGGFGGRGFARSSEGGRDSARGRRPGGGREGGRDKGKPIMGPRIVELSASYFLKAGGYFMISMKANCIDSKLAAETVFQNEVKKLQAGELRPREQLTLEPYERDHDCVVGAYRFA